MILTTKRIGIATLAACVVLAVIWYFALWSPESKSLKHAHAARAQAQAQVGQLQDQVIGLESLVRQIPFDQKEMATLKTALPDNPDLADVLNQLKGIADNTGITLSNVSPSTPGAASGSAQSGPPSITLSLSITGSYAQTISFLEALVALPRATTIRNLSISGTTASLTTTLTAYIFYANAGDTSGASSTVVPAAAVPTAGSSTQGASS